MSPNAGVWPTLFSSVRSRQGSAVLAMAACVILSSCASVGPPTVKRDRFDYVVAISDSLKRQTLLNLVKTRYVDMPIYMDVESVISQYSIEGELGFEFAPSFSDNNLLLGKGTYADRPTITYGPLTGEKYSRSLLKPLPISGIFLMLQQGYPADLILHVCVQTINGIDNQRTGYLTGTEADPRFVETLALIRDLQAGGAIYYRIEAKDERFDVKMVFRPTVSPEVRAKSDRLKQLLGLDAKARAFSVVFGAEGKSNTEIAVITRSMGQVMMEYAADIDVPQSDVEAGRVKATRPVPTGKRAIPARLIRVHQDTAVPDDAHVAVYYRGHWFWVADTDLLSKASLQFMMTLFSFTERGTAERQAPVITVPTN